MTNTHNGERYLMEMYADGSRFVVRATADEMTEMLSAAQIAELDSVGQTAAMTHDGHITVWIDMIQSATATFYGE